MEIVVSRYLQMGWIPWVGPARLWMFCWSPGAGEKVQKSPGGVSCCGRKIPAAPPQKNGGFVFLGPVNPGNGDE